MKPDKTGMSCFLMLLAVIFFCTPAFAEESIHERTETVEEAVLLSTSKEQMVSQHENHQQISFLVPLSESAGKTSTYFPTIKRYILYNSLRLCD